LLSDQLSISIRFHVSGTNDVTNRRWRNYADPNGKIIEAIFGIANVVKKHAPQATILIAAPILTKEYNNDNKYKVEQDAYAARVRALPSVTPIRRYIVKNMTALTEADLRDACELRTQTPRSMHHGNSTISYACTGTTPTRGAMKKWLKSGTMQLGAIVDCPIQSPVY
jgi:hypothetical protein